MSHSVVQVFVGFSFLAAPILLVAYLFFLRDMGKSLVGRIACVALLTAMFGMQAYHWLHLQGITDPFEHRLYVTLQLLTPPAFYFFSREVLVPGSTRSPFNLLHLMPLLASPLAPLKAIPVFGFIVGAGYSIWFAMYVFGLRRHVRRYTFELFFFCYFAVLAIVMLVLAVSAEQFGSGVFYSTYAVFTGATFVLVMATMIWFPETLIDISDAAKLAYATSTLKGVDIDEKLAVLKRCMDDDKIYQNENLNLNLLAEAVGLTAHQLSELINTRFGHGFSRFIREHRVAEAQRLLRSEPSASVLSIGMTCGFRSQSNFYTAFRELTGESPGAFRKRSAP